MIRNLISMMDMKTSRIAGQLYLSYTWTPLLLVVLRQAYNPTSLQLGNPY
jgi:hypothetical protein